MATVAAVYDGALEMLGVLSLGQTIGANDSARMARAYNQVFADIKVEGIATWASDGTVPDEMVPHVESLMAENASETYSIPSERLQRIMSKSKVAMREIRRLSTPKYESLDNPKDF